LKVGEFDDFKLELERRQWHRVLGNFPNEVDEVLVKEFYANAYNFDGSLPRQAKVWGKMTKFDRKALKTFLRTLVFPADRNTPYGDFMNEDKDFEAIAARLCIPGESYVIGVSSTHVRILRKHLNSLAQIWRGTRCLMDNLHKLSLAVLDTLDDYLMTSAHFDEYISWPRGRPKYQWGVVLLLTLRMRMMMVQMMLRMLLRRRFLLMMMLEMCCV